MRWVALTLSFIALPAAAVTSMFRGDVQHSGVYDTRPITRQPQLRWKFATNGPVRSSPAVARGVVFFGSGDGNLYAVRARDGRELWRFKCGGRVDSSPAVDGDRVVAASADGHAYCVDRRNGRQQWRAALGSVLPFKWGYDYRLSSPLIANGRVFIGSGDGHLYCLDLDTGARRWRFRTEGRVRSSPALWNETVYFGSMDGHLYAVDAQSGALRWKFETAGVTIDLEKEGYDRRSIASSPAIADGVLLFGARDAMQYALDPATGRLLWKAGTPAGRLPGAAAVSWVEGSAAISGGVAYTGVSDGRFVNARELRSGHELWRFETTHRVNASVALSCDVLVAGSEDGVVYALDAKSGRALWSFPTGDAIYSSPALADGVAYFGSDDGHLYAITDEGAPHRAVYYDETLPPWFTGAAAVRDVLTAARYTLLDAVTLGRFLEARVADGERSVIVFASDKLPQRVLAGGRPLLRRYLDAGGRAVWIGEPLFLHRLDDSGRPVIVEDDAMKRVLGFGGGPLTASDGEELHSITTKEGIAWGLPPWSVAAYSVPAKDAGIVLARDSNGDASAWVKRFERGGEFVRFWGRRMPLGDPSLVRRIAEGDRADRDRVKFAHR